MAVGRIKIETEIQLDIDVAAKWFAGLNDDEQAKFFAAVTQHFGDGLEYPWMRAESQWLAVGNHLATCKCSTEAAREMVRSIIYGMDHPWSHHPIDLRAKAEESEA